MRICFLADFHSIHTYRWVKFFAAKHEVHLISLEQPAEGTESLRPEKYKEIGIYVHFIPREGIIDKMRGPSRVKKLIEDIVPDIVHAHYITHYGYLAAKSSFHPTVMTAWGTDVLIEAHSSFIKRHQVKYALKRADALTCDGENTIRALREFVTDENKIRKIYFGVDTQKYNPGKRIEGFYKKYHKGIDGKIVINLRGFAEVYEPETFIKAVPAILERFPDTVFLMAREHDRRKMFEEMVSSMGLEEHVKFIGNIPADDLPVFLASSDIYVSNSISDSGIAASTAEAMASGTAIISTDVGDISQWIEDGRNGFIISKGDFNALSEKVKYLLSNDDIRKSIGREARKTIETKQDYLKEMTKVEELYESLIKEARS